MSVTVKMKKRVATRSAMEVSGSTGCEASIVLSHNDYFCNFFGYGYSYGVSFNTYLRLLYVKG